MPCLYLTFNFPRVQALSCVVLCQFDWTMGLHVLMLDWSDNPKEVAPSEIISVSQVTIKALLYKCTRGWTDYEHASSSNWLSSRALSSRHNLERPYCIVRPVTTWSCHRSDPTAFGRTTVETSECFLFTSMYYIILYRECIVTWSQTVLNLNTKQHANGLKRLVSR